MKLVFVCVGNAGRSQMAAALAERERDEREMDAEIVTGGVDPADSVHDDVVAALGEVGIDVSDRTPRAITPADVEGADYVVTMGCSIDQFRPDGWEGETVVWDLESSETVDQRDELARRVEALFDDLQRSAAGS